VFPKSFSGGFGRATRLSRPAEPLPRKGAAYAKPPPTKNPFAALRTWRRGVRSSYRNHCPVRAGAPDRRHGHLGNTPPKCKVRTEVRSSNFALSLPTSPFCLRGSVARPTRGSIDPFLGKPRPGGKAAKIRSKNQSPNEVRVVRDARPPKPHCPREIRPAVAPAQLRFPFVPGWESRESATCRGTLTSFGLCR